METEEQEAETTYRDAVAADRQFGESANWVPTDTVFGPTQTCARGSENSSSMCAPPLYLYTRSRLVKPIARDPFLSENL